MAEWDDTPKNGWNDDGGHKQSTSRNQAMNGNHLDHAGNGNGDYETLSNGGDFRGGKDNKCRNCGQEGHFSRDCTEEKKLTGECFNCGEVGHNKADCPNPKVERPFTGECRYCKEEGHRAAECPNKPPETCRNCLQEGHKASECEANRVLDRSKIPDMDQAVAWDMMQKAAADKEMIEFQEALKIFAKADPTLTYEILEPMLRKANIGVYLIALEKEIPKTMTNVNLQGKTGCKYSVGFFYKPTPTRRILETFWPTSPEENLARLRDAGETMDNKSLICVRCYEPGHSAKNCSKERPAPIAPTDITCSNCNEVGHRLRDCMQERAFMSRGGGDRSSMVCRNCNEEGHKAADCTVERAPMVCRICNEEGHKAADCTVERAPMVCRNCNEPGHKAVDCDQPKNEANMTCRNCDEVGHSAKSCPKPRDYSRVKCNNCGEMGHTVVRCKKELPEKLMDTNGGGDAGSAAGAGFSGVGEAIGGWDSGSPTITAGAW